MEMSRLTRDGTAEPVSQDQILRRERGEGNINFPCSADREQDWQLYPVDPYSCYKCDPIYISPNQKELGKRPLPFSPTRGTQSIIGFILTTGNMSTVLTWACLLYVRPVPAYSHAKCL